MHLMTDTPSRKRTDSASRVIPATPQRIYRALAAPEALIAWLPPKGMEGRILEFDARPGEAYEMALVYLDADSSAQGKTSANTDVVKGKFLELVPDKRIVQMVEFRSDDPVYAGEMTMTWTLTPVADGTEVSIVCENVPEGIRKEDHDVGMRSSLENLAGYLA